MLLQHWSKEWLLLQVQPISSCSNSSFHSTFNLVLITNQQEPILCFAAYLAIVNLVSIGLGNYSIHGYTGTMHSHWYARGNNILKSSPTPTFLGSFTYEASSIIIAPPSSATTTRVRMACHSKPSTATLQSAIALFDYFQVKRSEKIISFLTSNYPINKANIEINDSNMADFFHVLVISIKTKSFPAREARKKMQYGQIVEYRTTRL